MKLQTILISVSLMLMSCQTKVVHGCLDSQACNYDSTATIDNNSCDYGDCGGSCYNENIELWGECYNIEETTELDLAESGLTGEIPPEIGNLTNLEVLSLWDNQLTGEIPPEIGNLTNLTGLWLHDNDFTGEIPREIGNLTNLVQLRLRKNQFSGEIPKEIGSLTNLNSLVLYGNQLSGDIPQEVCDLIANNEEKNIIIEYYILQGNNLNNTCED